MPVQEVESITYMKINIRVNTIDRNYNGKRVSDYSGKPHFSTNSVISAEST